MTDEEKRPPGPPGVDLEQGTISYDYIKGNNFRVIHADGIWGGNAPQRGVIHMDVFSERWPIPKRTVNQFTEKEGVGEEIFEERISRNAVVREIEAHIVMNIAVAIKIRDWLSDKIENYERVNKEAEAKGGD